MRPPLIVITGTGTEIGKTHLARSVLMRWGRSVRCCGLKPVETGVAIGEEGADARALRLASTFHVKQPVPPYAFPRPVSPHLAARETGGLIDVDRVVSWVSVAAAGSAGVLVELAGGLFSPLAPGLTNADVVHALHPDVAILVAPDRLGVLHDVAAATRAADHSRVRLTAIALTAPAQSDASTGTNALELCMITDLPLVGVLPRGEPDALADHPAIMAIVEILARPRGE